MQDQVSWLGMAVLILVAGMIAVAITVAAGKRTDGRGSGSRGPTNAGLVLALLGGLAFFVLLTMRTGGAPWSAGSALVRVPFAIGGRVVAILPMIGIVALVWFMRNRDMVAHLDPRRRAYVHRGVGLLVAALVVAAVARTLRIENRFLLLSLPGGLFVLGLVTIFRARSGAYDGSDDPSAAAAPTPKPTPMPTPVSGETPATPPPSTVADASADAGGEEVAITKSMGDISIRLADTPVRGGRVSTGLGSARVDLRSVSVPPGEHHLAISSGVGKVEVKLPHETACRVELHSDVGMVRVGDRHDNGIDSSLSWESPGFAGAGHRLVIHATTILGNVVCS